MYKVKILIVSLWPWEYLWNTFEIAIMNSANALGQWICLQFASSDYLSNVGYYIDNPIFDQKVRISLFKEWIYFSFKLDIFG